jgi:hypothetical protein
VALIGERRGAYRFVVGTTEGKRALGRPRYIWEDNNNIFSNNIKIIINMGWEDMN